MPQNRTEIVRKSLDFIDDKGLQSIIEQRLIELERVFYANANFSTIILSISSIEGIFRHLANIFKNQILHSPKYPSDTKGKKKRFDKLTIEEIYKLLLERDILPEIEEFEHIYKLFRRYRNFIHPQRQKQKAWPVGLGQAQMALGLLNATIDQISQYIFIGTEMFERISGRPRFDLSKVLHLDIAETRTHSFMLLKRKIDSNFYLKFNVDLDNNAILNFVFNFVDEGNFKMLRLDNRDFERTPNALLYSKQKFHWNIIAEAEQKQPPSGPFDVEISINNANKQFEFIVKGEKYQFKEKIKKGLFPEFKKGLRVGWFNEEGPVKLSTIEIN